MCVCLLTNAKDITDVTDITDILDTVNLVQTLQAVLRLQWLPATPGTATVSVSKRQTRRLPQLLTHGYQTQAFTQVN